MRCSFDYCIYNRNDCCVLKEIRIDALGMCEESTLVSLSEKELDVLKSEQLKKLECE